MRLKYFNLQVNLHFNKQKIESSCPGSVKLMSPACSRSPWPLLLSSLSWSVDLPVRPCQTTERILLTRMDWAVLGSLARLMGGLAASSSTLDELEEMGEQLYLDTNILKFFFLE